MSLELREDESGCGEPSRESGKKATLGRGNATSTVKEAHNGAGEEADS